MTAPALLDAPTPELGVVVQLQAARGLLSDPARWTKGVTARDGHGRVVLPWDAHAACWCLLGAVRRHGVFGTSHAERLLDAAADELFGCRAPLASDRHGHAAALHICDRAIERAEAAR